MSEQEEVNQDEELTADQLEAAGQSPKAEERAPAAEAEPQEAKPEAEAEKKEKVTEEAIKRLSEEDLDAVVTLKINGEEKEMPVREAIKLTQLEQASRAKMQEAANSKKQAEQIVGLAQSDLGKFLEILKIDPYEFAEAKLAEKLEMLEMTEEERRAVEAEQKLQAYEAREKEREEGAKSQQEANEIAAETEKLDKEIGEAWKESGLPLEKEFVTAIAQEMYGASVRNENLTAKDAAGIVKDNWRNNVKSTISKLDAEAIHEILGDEVLKKIREFDIKRVTDKQKATQQFSSPGSSPASKGKKSQPMTEQEYEAWKDNLRQSL